MSEQKIVPKYAHIDYQTMHEMEISITEYFLLDMIYRLSGNGTRWCNKKLDNIAFDMRLTKRGVQKLRDRLIERDLLKKGVGNRLMTSGKWNKVHFLEESELQKVNKVPQKVNKVHPKVEQSSSKTSVENNKRITKNNVATDLDDFRGTESPAKERLRAMIKKKAQHGL